MIYVNILVFLLLQTPHVKLVKIIGTIDAIGYIDKGCWHGYKIRNDFFVVQFI